MNKKVKKKEAEFQSYEGTIDDGIEFLKFIKQLKKEGKIKKGFIGIDILPKSESNIINKLWDKRKYG